MTREKITLQTDAPFPNNPGFPLLCFRKVFSAEDSVPEAFEKRFALKGWGGMWRNGLFSFHHFHSNSHEALGCYGGKADVQFGGPEGPVLTIEKGDAVLVPAGVAHCLISADRGFHVVGAYPAGFTPDICEGGEYPMDKLRRRIDSLPPPSEPV